MILDLELASKVSNTLESIPVTLLELPNLAVAQPYNFGHPSHPTFQFLINKQILLCLMILSFTIRFDLSKDVILRLSCNFPQLKILFLVPCLVAGAKDPEKNELRALLVCSTVLKKRVVLALAKGHKMSLWLTLRKRMHFR